MRYVIRSPDARGPAHEAAASRRSVLDTKLQTRHLPRIKHMMPGLGHELEIREETVRDGHLEITNLIIKMAPLDYKVLLEVP